MSCEYGSYLKCRRAGPIRVERRPFYTIGLFERGSTLLLGEHARASSFVATAVTIKGDDRTTVFALNAQLRMVRAETRPVVARVALNGDLTRCVYPLLKWAFGPALDVRKSGR